MKRFISLIRMNRNNRTSFMTYIMQKINQFKFKGYGLLLGSSRKSWINFIDKSETNQRLGGSIASALYCYQKGVDIFRVHDIKETSQSLKIFEKLCSK